MYLSSVSNGLRVLTQALLPQLRADHEAAAALCRKVGLRSCKELREVKRVTWQYKGLTLINLATLATLGSVLPTLESFGLFATYPGISGGPNGVQRLAEGLGAGALQAVACFHLASVHVRDAGASALAAALGRAALPRLKYLYLDHAAIGDAGWWPSRRRCGDCPRWRVSISTATRSATRALPPSWRRRRRPVRCRRRLEC